MYTLTSSVRPSLSTDARARERRAAAAAGRSLEEDEQSLGRRDVICVTILRATASLTNTGIRMTDRWSRKLKVLIVAGLAAAAET